MTTTPPPLTADEIADLRKLHEEAFRAPWTYDRWEVECEACEGGTNEPEAGCPNPDCNGADAPIVAIESPEEYPNGQLVAQISVPGLLSLADKNGELIAKMRNALPALLAASERAAELERFLEEHGDSVEQALRFSEEQYRAIQHLDQTVRDDLAKRERSIEAFRALRGKR